MHASAINHWLKVWNGLYASFWLCLACYTVYKQRAVGEAPLQSPRNIRTISVPERLNYQLLKWPRKWPLRFAFRYFKTHTHICICCLFHRGANPIPIKKQQKKTHSWYMVFPITDLIISATLAFWYKYYSCSTVGMSTYCFTVFGHYDYVLLRSSLFQYFLLQHYTLSLL